MSAVDATSLAEPLAVPDHRPAFPPERPAVAVLGYGAIARTAHLPAYRAYGVPVAGVHSRNPAHTADVSRQWPEVGRVYGSVAELLADPGVAIVDLATGPAGRVDLIDACVRAGKHVLAQKPLVADAADLARLDDVLDRADAAGVTVAVNQNGRWAPAWRLATLLVRRGDIGTVIGVTHLHDKPLPPVVGTPFDRVEHMLIADYLTHWIDITRCWLGGEVATAAVLESRNPGQPDEARNPWSATVGLLAPSGATATLRIVGDVRATSGGCPFWIHGTEGTIRGSVLLGSDAVALDRDGTIRPIPLTGAWFVDGFAGAMAELMSAIAQDRPPEHAAREVAGTVRVTLAAVESARRGGDPVPVTP